MIFLCGVHRINLRVIPALRSGYFFGKEGQVPVGGIKSLLLIAVAVTVVAVAKVVANVVANAVANAVANVVASSVANVVAIM